MIGLIVTITSFLFGACFITLSGMMVFAMYKAVKQRDFFSFAFPCILFPFMFGTALFALLFSFGGVA